MSHSKKRIEEKTLSTKIPSLATIFSTHKGKVSDKWEIYITEYERIFRPYRTHLINMLEIGIQNGGSLEIWGKYFAKAKKIVGCDINPDCAKLEFDDSRIALVVLNANSDEAEQQIAAHSPEFDLIIDDGSHHSGDIVRSFDRYFPRLKNNGLFVAEDLHCSYWQDYEGGIYQPYSSMAFFKLLADTINHEHWGVDKTRSELLRSFNRQYDTRMDEVQLAHIHSIEFVNSMCIIKKAQPAANALGNRQVAGTDALVDARPLQLHGSQSSQPNQRSNQWSIRDVPIEEELQSRIQEIIRLNQSNEDRVKEIAGLNRTAAEREQAHLAQLTQARQQIETQQTQLVEREKAFFAQLQEIQQAHAQQRGELHREYAEREQTHRAQLTQARQQIETQLIQLAEREKVFSAQLQEIQQAHAQQRGEQHREYAEREQAHLAQLAQAQQQIETQLTQLAEREKAFSAQLQEMQQLHEQQKSEQSHEHAEHEQALNAQLVTKQEEMHQETLRWMEAEKEYAQTLAELQYALSTMRGTYSWRWIAPLRALAVLFRKKSLSLPPAARLEVNEILTSEQAKDSHTQSADSSAIFASLSNSNNRIFAMPQNLTNTSASSLDELLSHYDEQFIRSAYHTVLGRAPDPEGMRYYLARIRAGISKIEILAQLRKSVEGKSKNHNIDGLDKLITRYKLMKIPLIGLLSKVVRFEYADSRERRIKSVENKIHAMDARLAREFYDIKTLIINQHAKPTEQIKKSKDKIKINDQINIFSAPNVQMLDDENIIVSSGLFDTKYYLGSYPDVAASGQNPLQHFCNHGWIEDCNPNEDFNTRYYKEKYTDVAAAGMNPFVHWLKYGQNESRIINCIEIDPTHKKPDYSPSIIFVSHEASQTGAPAVLLTLMQWIKDNTDINFSIIVGSSGPWNKKFENLAPTFFMENYHHHELDVELKQFCGTQVKVVYLNTIASAYYAEHLKFLQAEFITHVHEMEYAFQIFEPHIEVLKQICSKYIAVSQGSIDAIQKRFNMDQIEVKFLKPFINKKRPSDKPTNKPIPKKAVFGCGAVEMRKGFDIFCVTAATLKAKGRDDFKFYWIGSDSNKELVASEVIALHDVADVVDFLGVQDYPRDHFAWGDIFILPSREDPYPLVCMEAAECDMPVVCFDEQAGGMHSFVEGDAGVVVPYMNIDLMADAIASLLDDEAKRTQFGKTAHQKVIDRHYVNVIAPQILDFLPQSIRISDTTELESYKRHIEQAKAVSFDIFDTLVTRKLHDPKVVFDIIEYKHTHSEAAPLPLFNERMQTAGKVLGSYQGQKDDISIDEIYANMSFYQDAAIEKETEIQMCTAHPMGKTLYDYAQKLGKRMIIASDMYLDKDTVQTILTQNGYEGWDAFYLSSEKGKKKDTGKLFEQLKLDAKQHNIESHEVLHLGDNWIGDVKYARQAGLMALRFAPIYDKEHKLFNLDATQESQLSQIGRIWNSFATQATRLWRETHPEASQEFYTRLGFELTGPLAAMMAMHTRALADEIGTQKIVFMARDGRIIKKAFDRLYQAELKQQQYQSEYMSLSRSTVIPATFEHPLSSNDIYFLIEGLHLQQKPVSYFIKKANLASDVPSVQAITQKYFKSLETIPVMEDLNKLARMFAELSGEIHQANAQNREALKRYLQQYGVLDAQKVLFVDVGWMLNIQSRLDRFIKELGASTQVVGSYVGSRDRINKSLSHTSLLFDNGDPYMYANFIEENVTLFEVLFSSPEPSAASLENTDDGVKVNYKLLQKPIPDNEFQVAQKLHYGAEAFFEHLAEAKREFFPEQISKDYFFKLFKALVNTDLDIAKATLGHFEVRLGGHHEFVAYQKLVKTTGHFEYKLKQHNEYFAPIKFSAEASQTHVTLVTSAGLDNGSTRYRAIHLADALKHQGISSTLIHAATPIEKANTIIKGSQSIVFQRCFAAQGHVGAYLDYAKSQGIKCIAETDDLVLPDFVHTIGSVKGGQWPIEHAMEIATAYEKLIQQVDACIVSTPPLKDQIEKSYNIPALVVRNKVTPKRLKAPSPVDGNNIKLIYASGTYSHKEDFEIIEAVLYEFLLAHPQVTLSVLGAAQVSERILALANVANYPLMQYDAMLEFIAQHDLMLVPLADDEFNRAKSSVKFVECSAVGVPVLASQVGEFDYAIEHGQNGVLAATAEAFKQELERMATDPKIIEQLANNANQTIKKFYTTHSIEEGVVEMVKG